MLIKEMNATETFPIGSNFIFDTTGSAADMITNKEQRTVVKMVITKICWSSDPIWADVRCSPPIVAQINHHWWSSSPSHYPPAQVFDREREVNTFPLLGVGSFSSPWWFPFEMSVHHDNWSWCLWREACLDTWGAHETLSSLINDIY